MSKKPLKISDAQFKTEVVLESFKERNTIDELSHKYEVSSSIITLWRNEVLLKLPEIFSTRDDSKYTSEQQTKKLYAKAISDAIWDWDLVAETFVISDGFQTIFGYDQQEIKMNIDFWTNLIHQDDSKRIVEGINQFIVGGDTNRVAEYRYRKADQTYANVLDKAFVIRDAKGKAVRMVGAMQDITGRKKEEQHLRLLESVVTNTTDAVLITEAEPFDLPGPKIVYVNEAFTKMTGYTPEEVIGKTPRMLQGAKTDRNEIKRLSESLRKWDTCEVTVVNYKKNGEEFWINMSISPVADKNGWFTHWISIERDVTERKNEDLQKKLLTGEISRLFNQPVTLSETLQQVLKRLLSYGNFTSAEAWLIGTDQQKINLAASYYTTNPVCSQNNRSNCKSSYTIDEGLPGVIWSIDAIQLQEDIKGNDFFKKNDLIHTTALHNCYGIPIMHNKQLIGAFVLEQTQALPLADNLRSILEHVGTYVGTEIRRKQLEEELSQIFSLAPDIIFVAGFDGYFKKISPAAFRLLEHTEEELLAVPISEFVHPDDREKIVLDKRTLSKGNTSNYFENRCITKSGAVKWMAWTLQPAYEEGLLFGVAKDITAKKEYEEKIKFHANLLHAVGQAVIATDMNGKIIYWNTSAVKIYGWDIEEVSNKNINAILPTLLTSKNRSEIKKDSQKNESWSDEIVVKKKTGESFPAAVSNSFIHNEQGELIGIISVSIDITERKKNELALENNAKALAASNDELEQFAYIASHDLQEPLRMVTSFLNKLEKKYENVIDVKGKRYIEFAVDGSKRMRQIILDLLEFSRIERQEYVVENINLNELIEEIKTLYRNRINKKNASVVYSNLPIINSSKASVRQVFENLISNALKYTSNDVVPQIHITSTESENHWTFSVQDNGIGINKEYFDKIFIIFQRLHSKNEFSGTGIGLAVTKKIVEKQGGKIWVESEVGKGSTFHFSFIK